MIYVNFLKGKKLLAVENMWKEEEVERDRERQKQRCESSWRKTGDY